MKNRKYKILVLSDLKESTKATLNSAIGLAKMIDAEIEVLHVKSATDIVDRESQLSAVRNINEQYIVADKKIKELLEPLSKNHNLKIKHKYASGNVKEEIENYINEVKPDILVLGKKKKKALSFIGDNITDFVLKKFKGEVVIASNENSFEPNMELSLGVLNGSLNTCLAENLLSNTNTTIKSFRIGSSKEESRTEVSENKTVEYIFEDNSNVIKTLSNYIAKNNINLLCLDRANSNNKTTNYSKDVINKVNVSLLVT